MYNLLNEVIKSKENPDSHIDESINKMIDDYPELLDPYIEEDDEDEDDECEVGDIDSFYVRVVTEDGSEYYSDESYLLSDLDEGYITLKDIFPDVDVEEEFGAYSEEFVKDFSYEIKGDEYIIYIE